MNQSKDFNPDGVGIKGTLFGLPFNEDNASLVVIPVPWEVTVSYGAGTSDGPMNILDASTQVDLFDPEIKEAWKLGITMLEIDPVIQEKSFKLRHNAMEYIRQLEMGDDGVEDEEDLSSVPAEVDEGCEEMIGWVRDTASRLINKGKIVGLVGGDHSTPLGFMEALSAKHGNFGILQIDAHADLRIAYEGFKYSHASIMYNVLQNDFINKLVQVGIRDFGEEEYKMIGESEKISCFFDRKMKERLLEGGSWKSICKEIVDSLPEKIYISFDIDGLIPSLCPGTGTPVPGGLDFEMAVMLIREAACSGKEIIGFDLVEVGAHPWDGNVGARMLYELCKWTGVANKKLSLSH